MRVCVCQNVHIGSRDSCRGALPARCAARNADVALVHKNDSSPPPLLLLAAPGSLGGERLLRDAHAWCATPLAEVPARVPGLCDDCASLGVTHAELTPPWRPLLGTMTRSWRVGLLPRLSLATSQAFWR